MERHSIGATTADVSTCGKLETGPNRSQEYKTEIDGEEVAVFEVKAVKKENKEGST